MDSDFLIKEWDCQFFFSLLWDLNLISTKLDSPLLWLSKSVTEVRNHKLTRIRCTKKSILSPADLHSTCWSSLTCRFLSQIKGMKERLDFWCGDVKNMAMLVEQQAHDILTWTSSPSVHRGKPHCFTPTSVFVLFLFLSDVHSSVTATVYYQPVNHTVVFYK